MYVYISITKVYLNRYLILHIRIYIYIVVYCTSSSIPPRVGHVACTNEPTSVHAFSPNSPLSPLRQPAPQSCKVNPSSRFGFRLRLIHPTQRQSITHSINHPLSTPQRQISIHPIYYNFCFYTTDNKQSGHWTTAPQATNPTPILGHLILSLIHPSYLDQNQHQSLETLQRYNATNERSDYPNLHYSHHPTQAILLFFFFFTVVFPTHY